MKVLIVRTFPDILNLNTYNVQEIGLAKALTVKGIECGVVLYNGRNADRIENYEFEKEGRKYSFIVYWLKGFSIYKNGFMPSVYKLMKKYDVLQAHEYDQIFSFWLYTNRKIPAIVYHGPYYHEYAKGYNLKCRVFDLLFLRWRRHDQVVALTKSEMASDFLRTKGFRRVHTVGVGVDSDAFIAQQDEKVVCRIDNEVERFRLLYVGKIEERRNVFFLADVFDKLLKIDKRFQLVLVGSGEVEYTQQYHNRINDGINRGDILYLPSASQKELALIYQNVNMFVFTSNYEIFGMVLLEALYFGLPVISSKNGGASVLIKEGLNGYIMDSFAEEEWINRICYLKDHTNVYESLRTEAHKTVQEHFLWDKLADKFVDAYSEAVNISQNEKM